MTDTKPQMRNYLVVTNHGDHDDSVTFSAAYYQRSLDGELLEFKDDSAKIVFAIPVTRLAYLKVMETEPSRVQAAVDLAHAESRSSQ
jgi:hypothetical protein